MVLKTFTSLIIYQEIIWVSLCMACSLNFNNKPHTKKRLVMSTHEMGKDPMVGSF